MLVPVVFDLAGRFTRSVSWSDLLTQARLYKAPMVSLIVGRGSRETPGGDDDATAAADADNPCHPQGE